MFIYRYRDDLWKVVRVSDNTPSSVRDKVVRDDKTLENIRRAARMIEAYGLCNEWDYFVTLTVDPRKYENRLDLDTIRKDFMQMIRDVRKAYKADTAVLIVPELHANRQGWHFHGFIKGLPEKELSPFALHGSKLPPHVVRKIKEGKPIYDWPRYSGSFGFCDIEPIGNRDAATRYIKKYITKGLDATAKNISVGKHCYFVSRGLTLPEKWESANACTALTLPIFLRGLSPESSYQWDYGVAEWYKLDEAHQELITQTSMLSSYEGSSCGCEFDDGGDLDDPDEL